MKRAHALSLVRESRPIAVLRHVRERRRRILWPPEAEGSPTRDRVAVVVVNHNTRELISHLLFSLHRIVGRDQIAEVVVVDNASTDGSLPLLEAMAGAGLIHLIPNVPARYHGSGLNQGISWLAARQSRVMPNERIDYIWVLDSDTLVLRSDVVRDALACFATDGPSIIGESFGIRDGYEHLTVFTLMFRPAAVWRRGVAPFSDDGIPEKLLLESIANSGGKLLAFPFLRQSYVLHLGSGTLRQVAQGEWSNRFYGFSLGLLDREDFNYTDHPLGPHLRAEVVSAYDREVARPDPHALVDACRRSELIEIPLARPLPPPEVLQQLWENGIDLAEYMQRHTPTQP